MRYVRLLAASGLASALVAPGMAQASPHAEACMQKTWGYLKAVGYEFGALNTCAYPVAVWFKTRKSQTVQATVQPGEFFRTGLTIDKFESERRDTGWVAAICRSSEVPAREISDSTWDAILDGKYECRKP
jgi:hypothetical protein